MSTDDSIVPSRPRDFATPASAPALESAPARPVSSSPRQTAPAPSPPPSVTALSHSAPPAPESVLPYVRVLRMSALGVYAQQWPRLLSDTAHFKAAKKQADQVRALLESTVFARVVAAGAAERERAYIDARGDTTFSQLVMCSRDPADELVSLPLHALLALPAFLTALAQEQELWAKETRLDATCVKLRGGVTYTNVTLWELRGLLDGSLLVPGVAPPLFNAALVPLHAPTLALLDGGRAPRPLYTVQVLRDSALDARVLPALLAYSWDTVAKLGMASAAECEIRVKAQKQSREFVAGVE